MTLDPLVTPADSLTPDETARYSRHLLLPGIGLQGQLRLKNARVLVIGAGGLGSPVLLYLAAAGVGTIGIVDDDVVDDANLQRQVVHDDRSVSRLKTDSARDRLTQLNPHVTVECYSERLTASNALPLFENFDLVVDGSDNFATRYLVNDAAVFTATPYVWASVFRFDGAVSVFWPPHGPCYRCIYPQPPHPDDAPSCGVGGVLGAVTGVLGSLQAVEALKLITGVGEPLIGRLLMYDAGAGGVDEIVIRRDPDCAACGTDPSVTELIDYEAFCAVEGSRPQLADDLEIESAELETLLQLREQGRTSFTLIDVREPAERSLANLDGSINHPVASLVRDPRAFDLDPDESIIVYCKSGARSARAVTALRAAGYLHVRHLKGGVLNWLDAHPDAGVRY